MHKYANPLRYQRIADAIFPWALIVAITLTIIGLYQGLVIAPAHEEQGEVYRIMFVHVPAAWMALMVYAMMTVASIVSIIWRHPLAEIAARAAAPIGAVFTLAALITGSIWGKPTWGTYWAWDARMTSVLILFFLYIGYIALHDAFDDPNRGARAAAILCLVGSVNLPIIKFSVEFWNTLHQPASVLRADGPAIHPSMLTPLLVMWGAYMCFFVAVHILRTRAELTERKIRNLRLSVAEPAE